MARFDAQELGGWQQDVATLAGSLVHEVKNPLSTLNINTQLLLEEWERDPQNQRELRTVKRLTVMRAEIQRIEHLVNSFLRFTQQQMLEMSRFDLNELLADLLARNAEGFERRGIRVHFQPDKGLPPVELDSGLIYQAFLNLVRNAEQAMPEGGELIIRTRAGQGSAEGEVIDTGEGIPGERLPKIFRPYFSAKRDGTGLGLSTTLQILRRHGGNIVVESEVGKGSRFIVSVPTSGPAAAGETA